MAASPPVANFRWKIRDFTLPATDGKTYSLADIKGQYGTLLMFICNHCPYVLSVIDRIVRDASELQKMGIGVAAICSNDATTYPQDSFENMGVFATEHGFTFPYLHDEDQAMARDYDAVCTPDFFGFCDAGRQQYRGRLDASRNQAAAPDVRRDLFEAMKLVVETGQGPMTQTPSMGCSIKWK